MYKHYKLKKIDWYIIYTIDTRAPVLLIEFVNYNIFNTPENPLTML